MITRLHIRQSRSCEKDPLGLSRYLTEERTFQERVQQISFYQACYTK